MYNRIGCCKFDFTTAVFIPLLIDEKGNNSVFEKAVRTYPENLIKTWQAESALLAIFLFS